MLEWEILPSWLNSKEAWEWYVKEADRVLELTMEFPDYPVEVSPDVAEFMGAFEERMDVSGYDFSVTVPSEVRDEMEMILIELGIWEPH
jgi:hypothetical protein